jgi:uncharacterized membrane protein
MKIKHSVIINKPIEEVFAYVTHLDNEILWQPQIQKVYMTCDSSLCKGATFVEIRQTFGRRFEWVFQVTLFEDNKRYCIETISGTIPYKGCRIFEAVDGGTKVTEAGELETNGFFKIFNPLLVLISRRPLAVAYKKLKYLL